MNLRTKSSAGLGSQVSHDLSLDHVGHAKSRANWAKTRERFHAIESQEKGEAIAGPAGEVSVQQQRGGWVQGQTQTSHVDSGGPLSPKDSNTGRVGWVGSGPVRSTDSNTGQGGCVGSGGHIGPVVSSLMDSAWLC